MLYRSKCLATAAAVSFSCAVSLHAESLKPIGAIAIPGNPINQFGAMIVDQASGLGYLAEKDNKGIVVFDTKTDTFVKRIGGFGGNNAKGELAGPNGVLVVNNGAELWVSDGDSTVRVVNIKSGAVASVIQTGGKERANAMGYNPVDGVVIVANSNEEVPYINLISTAPDHKIIAKIPVPDSAENIERSVFHAASSMFYTAIPVLVSDRSKGILAQIDAKSGKLISRQ
jgi:DNA-binding beta-propeller fold protein YncE